MFVFKSGFHSWRQNCLVMGSSLGWWIWQSYSMPWDKSSPRGCSDGRWHRKQHRPLIFLTHIYTTKAHTRANFLLPLRTLSPSITLWSVQFWVAVWFLNNSCVSTQRWQQLSATHISGLLRSNVRSPINGAYWEILYWELLSKCKWPSYDDVCL